MKIVTINPRRIAASLAVLVAGSLLAACSADIGAPSVTPMNLTAANAITDMECDLVNEVSDIVSESAAARETSGLRRQLLEWGLNPSDSEQLTEVREDLSARSAACREDGDGESDATASFTSDLMREKEEETQDASDPDAPPPSDGEAGIENPDGELASLPLVDQIGTDVTPADTTSDPRTPGTYADALEDGPVQNWAEIVDRMGDEQWYIDGVNQRAGKTGFNWDDVKKWAADGVNNDTRVLQVFNMPGITDDEARDRAEELIGSDVDNLPIARHNTCIVNTRGFGRETMQDFVDCRQMVRVTLAPLVYDNQGNLTGVRSDAGIFVDCFNVWWLPRQVVKNGPPPAPQAAPPQVTSPPVATPPTTTTPPRMPPTSTTPPNNPPTSTPPSPKAVANHPVTRGNAPQDTWAPAPAPTAQPTAPAAGTPPVVREQPAPPPPPVVPRPEPPPPPEVEASPSTAPEPPGDPCEVNPDFCD